MSSPTAAMTARECDGGATQTSSGALATPYLFGLARGRSFCDSYRAWLSRTSFVLIVDHEPERLHLRRRPFIAQDDRHFRDAEFARSLQPEMAVNGFAVTAREDRDFEAELPNAAA